MKKWLLITLLSLLSWHCWKAEAQAFSPSFYESIAFEKELTTEVEFLCSPICAGRLTGTAGNCEAAFHIIRRMEKARLKPLGDSYVHPFSLPESIHPNPHSLQKQSVTESGTLAGHNIIGFFDGSTTQRAKGYVLVLTHYDHLGTLDGNLYSGADSGASGVVAMLSVAQMLSTQKITSGVTSRLSVIFAALDAHHHALEGSYALFREISQGRLKDPSNGKIIGLKDIRLVVNIDQCGCSLAPIDKRKDYLIVLGTERLSPGEQRMVWNCNLTSRSLLEIGYDYYGSKTFTDIFSRLSDQRPFKDAGLRTMLVTSGITMTTNRTGDLPQTLDYAVLRRRIIFIYSFLREFIH